MKTHRGIVLSSTPTGLLGFAACGTTFPPQDLMHARTAFARANTAPTPQSYSGDLHSAKEQLDLAEASYAKDGDTQYTRDQSYLAVRKTELAEVVGRTRQTDKEKNGVVNAMHADEKQAVASTSAELGRTRTQLANQNVAYVAQGTALKDEKSRR